MWSVEETPQLKVGLGNGALPVFAETAACPEHRHHRLAAAGLDQCELSLLVGVMSGPHGVLPWPPGTLLLLTEHFPESLLEEVP